MGYFTSGAMPRAVFLASLLVLSCHHFAQATSGKSKATLLPLPQAAMGRGEGGDSHSAADTSTSSGNTLDQWGRPMKTASEPPSLLIGVMTAPNHFLARKAIRETYAKYLSAGNAPTSERKVELKFFIGKQENATIEKMLSEESDLVRLSSFTESYLNLTRKTIEIVHWAKVNGFDTVVKVDDDTYLRIDLFLEFLDSFQSTENIYAGHFQDHGWVIDNPDSKWYMRDQYNEEYFPSYAFGPCYFLGEDIVNFISGNRETLFPYRVEDAAIAIWIQDKLDVDRVEMPQFLYQAVCAEAGENALYVSPLNAKEMYVIQENLESGSLCGPDPSNPFVLDECKRNRCVCWPPQDCFSNFADGAYSDVIPR